MRFTSRPLILLSASFVAIASASSLSAQAPQTADELIARYIKAVGGLDKIKAVSSLRRVGKYNGGGGFEAIYIQENKRPDLVREEFTFQGMTAINAWDGRTGWKIDPFGGKKDAEALSEDEMHGVLLDADFDEPLVNYRAKGNKIELAGTDQVEGTDVYKLKVTLKNGDIRTYYLDTEFFVPIKVDDTRTIRGSDQETETILGDYKQVAGWYIPFSIETGRKGDQNRAKFTWDNVEPNVVLDDSRFHKPEIK